MNRVRRPDPRILNAAFKKVRRKPTQENMDAASKAMADEALYELGFPDFSVDVSVFMVYSHGVLIRENCVERGAHGYA